MRFNKGSKYETKTSHQGGTVGFISPKAELIKIALTSLMEETFYEKSSDLVKRVESLCEKVENKHFILKLALWGRTNGLRSINHLFTACYVKYANIHSKRRLLTNALYGVNGFERGIIWRPDEMMEIVGAWKHITGSKTKIPASLKSAYKSLIESNKFDDYQYSKYKNKGTRKLHDLVNLVRPKGKNADMIANGEYKAIETFEKVSSKGEGRGDKLSEMVKNDTLGEKAFLLNLGNMCEDGIDQNILLAYLDRHSFVGIFPYEFIRTAWYAHERGLSEKLVAALCDKAVNAFGELGLEGKTAVLVDTSGSMTRKSQSTKSTMTMRTLASFYGAIAQRNGGVTYAWASRTEKIKTFPNDSLLRVVDSIEKTDVGAGTYIQQAINKVKDEYENILIFSDMQIADRINNTGKVKKVFCFDLSQYGNTMKTKGNIISVAGFDDKMIKSCSELDNTKMIEEEIDAIDLYSKVI